MAAHEIDCLSQLEAKLRADSVNETPPWASDAVALASRCGDVASQWLLRRVADAGSDAFLALEALRINFPAAWASIPREQRAATYVTHLATAHWFNVWGQPGELPSESGKALIDTGVVAIRLLTPLLDSQRPAPSFGSEEATMSRLLAYRVCDYAWFFISQIEGQARRFLESPQDRDLAIGRMKERLQRRPL